VDRDGRLVGKYRKIHLPGHAQHEPGPAIPASGEAQFRCGNLGFGVWRMLGGVIGTCICNDRRRPETYRVMGLPDADLIVLGYTTPVHDPPAPEHDLLGNFHNQLSMQARIDERFIVGSRFSGVHGIPTRSSPLGSAAPARAAHDSRTTASARARDLTRACSPAGRSA
jgi:hypothetical protein